MEAMAKLEEGQKFNEVASAYSEDKARQGVSWHGATGRQPFHSIPCRVVCRETWAG